MKKIKLVLRVLILVVITGLHVGCSFLFDDIGERGSGGGLIFYVRSERYECSDVLGKATWEDAQVLAKNYRGGGYSDWYLPDAAELEGIEEDLYNKNYIYDTEILWSSSDEYGSQGDDYAYTYKLGDLRGFYLKSFPFNVRAVRRL